MITSRPEAWQSMKRHYRLTESRYYRQLDTEELEVELKGFDQQASGYWLAMDRFKPVSYLRSTDCTDNTVSRPAENLRDEGHAARPLALRLVAEACGSLAKPEKDGICHTACAPVAGEHHIRSLADDSRLERADVEVFLKQKLLS
jgi:hypothetical protein